MVVMIVRVVVGVLVVDAITISAEPQPRSTPNDKAALLLCKIMREDRVSHPRINTYFSSRLEETKLYCIASR